MSDHQRCPECSGSGRVYDGNDVDGKMCSLCFGRGGIPNPMVMPRLLRTTEHDPEPTAS